MKSTSLAGQLMLAMPSLKDPNFRDSVVLICHHDEEGAMGLVINRPQQIDVGMVIDDLKLSDEERRRGDKNVLESSAFEGGPVDPFRGFVLHDGWYVYDSTMQITPELHLTTSRDVLEEIAKGTGPEHFMLVLGYAGWEAGQIESEIGHNDWLIAPANHKIIFNTEPEQRWSDGAMSVGITRSKLSSQYGHA